MAVISTIAVTQIATAADMPVKTPVYKAPVVAPLYNWSGFYLGINGGYSWGKTNGDYFLLDAGNFNIDGGVVGGQIGFNYQFPASPFVLGIEADWDWANIRGSSFFNPPALFSFNSSAKIENLGSVRGRIGYAWDRVLLYGTGGWAWSSRMVADFACSGVCITPAAKSESHALSGYIVGGGVEYGITPNLSVKAEYLYVHLAPTDYFLSLVYCAPGTCTVGANVNLVRLGLNWRFADLP